MRSIRSKQGDLNVKIENRRNKNNIYDRL